MCLEQTFTLLGYCKFKLNNFVAGALSLCIIRIYTCVYIIYATFHYVLFMCVRVYS